MFLIYFIIGNDASSDNSWQYFRLLFHIWCCRDRQVMIYELTKCWRVNVSKSHRTWFIIITWFIDQSDKKTFPITSTWNRIPSDWIIKSRSNEYLMCERRRTKGIFYEIHAVNGEGTNDHHRCNNNNLSLICTSNKKETLIKKKARKWKWNNRWETANLRI